jgi:hypothetical protein
VKLGLSPSGKNTVFENMVLREILYLKRNEVKKR